MNCSGKWQIGGAGPGGTTRGTEFSFTGKLECDVAEFTITNRTVNTASHEVANGYALHVMGDFGAAIYARFSTDLQNERSIEDQFTLCQAYAACEELEVVKTHHNRARSDGSVMGLARLLRLLDLERKAKYEVNALTHMDALTRKDVHGGVLASGTGSKLTV